MAPGTGADQDQSVHARLERLLGMPDTDHVMEYNASIFVDLLHDIVRRAQAGDDHRHAMTHTGIQIAIEPVVGVMDNLVDRIRGDSGPGLRLPMSVERALDLRQPGIEDFGGARVQCREGPDHAIDTLLDDQRRDADDEHGCADDRQGHLAPQLVY